jgi:hypothetical protein
VKAPSSARMRGWKNMPTIRLSDTTIRQTDDHRWYV